MARLFRDEHGVPHVRAGDVLDLAHGQGEVTARDRAFQLEWLRRRATGTTAAVVGPAGLDWDVLARRTRLVDVARRGWAALEEESRAFVSAYVDGVNVGLADPGHAEVPELAALGTTPQPWEEWTPLAVFLAQHLLFANLGGKLWGQRTHEALGDGADLLDPEGPEGGSNAWVVGGARAASGWPLVAGDPHRVIESPGAYLQVRLACEDPDDAFDVVGFAFPGVPGAPHFAHAGEVAWAITNAMADYQDVYAVRLDAADPASVTDHHVEVVEVAGQEPVQVEVVRTPWGDVIEGGLAEGRGLALRTAVSELGDTGLGALLGLLRARSADDVEAAFAGWVEPVNNLVVADRGGAVRYRLVGRVPLRDDANRRRLADPDDPAAEWRGWLDPPRPDDVGPDGALVTANDRRGPESEDVGALFAGPYRRDRLWALLEDRRDLTVADLAGFHDDALLDPRARLTVLTDGWDGWLAGWDGRMEAGSADAALFAAWRSSLTRRVVAEPVLDPLRVPAPSAVHAPSLDLTVRVGRALPTLAATDRPLGIDLVAHAEAARDEVLAARDAARAAGRPADTWGDTHVFAPVHPLGVAAPAVAAVPAVPLSGDTDCVRACASYPGLTDACGRGSVARYAWDLADVQASGWVVPTGTHADPRSPHHHDQLDAWAAGRLLPVVTDWDRLAEEPLSGRRDRG
ncbi:penicillin acylase family protein [Nocardioides sp. AX2bis]|uniref:penicillin acylase family protein n=1 Tax=Nocardioides sp. AX2bis TaxID=2653157 RepID=UPI0012EEF439|nr:penicillin acylase family protein [Nocardioides sp. AX2bis]VXB89306.1 Penicillin amidase [Nocardioides sp. AX2bis]